jgi:hypothetical protein
MERDIVKRIEDLMDLFDEGGRVPFQGGTDPETGMGFQKGNPGNVTKGVIRNPTGKNQYGSIRTLEEVQEIIDNAPPVTKKGKSVERNAKDLLAESSYVDKKKGGTQYITRKEYDKYKKKLKFKATGRESFVKETRKKAADKRKDFTKKKSSPSLETKMAASKKSGLNLHHAGFKESLTDLKNLMYIPGSPNRKMAKLFEDPLIKEMESFTKVFDDVDASPLEKQKAATNYLKNDRALRQKYPEFKNFKTRFSFRRTAFEPGIMVKEKLPDPSLAISQEPGMTLKGEKPSTPKGKKILELALADLAAKIDPDGCGRKKSATGGRIGLQFGSTPCALKAKKRLDQIILRGTKNKSEQALANQILKIGRSLKDFASIRGTLGPAALAFTAATEAGLVGYDMLAEGKTFKEAVGDSVFNYALGPKLKIDSVQERNKRFRKLGVSEEDMGKIGAYESALQDIEQFDKTFEEAQTAQQRLDEATDAIDPTLFPGTIDELQKNLNVARANVQDLYRAGDPYQRLIPAIEPTGLAALQEAQKLATVDRLTSAGPRFLGKAFPKYEESRQQRILDASSFINPADKLLTDVGISYLAEGGLSGGDKSGPPPERGPNPQGLLSLKNRVRNL